MHSDVALAHGAEQGVHQGMEQHVGVGMARQAGFMGNLDTAEDQFSVRLEAVDIEALAHPVAGVQNPISFCSHRDR
jgi:hypothetical protein